MIRNLVARTGCQVKMPTVFKLGMQRARKTQQDVAFFAPVVSQVSGAVLNHTHANRAKLTCAPKGFAGGARVLGDLHA